MDAKVKEFLSNLHITVPSDWLRECIQFVFEDAGHQAKQPTWAKANVPKLVYEQWLEANLRELESPCLPPNLADIKRTDIRGHFALQVNSVLDISQPAYQQCMKIEGVDRSNAEVTAEPLSQKKEKSNRMLKLEMTDGVQTIHGMEYEEVPFLNVNLPPGTKVLVFGSVECRRGILFLKQENVKVLGGQVEDLGAENCQLRLLRRILNLPDNPNSAEESRHSTNGNVDAPNTAPALPWTSVGQGHASQGFQTLDDEDDSIFLEHIEISDLNNRESQNVPRSNIPRPSLTANNAVLSNQVDFDGFDDDDDDAFQ